MPFLYDLPSFGSDYKPSFNFLLMETDYSFPFCIGENLSSSYKSILSGRKKSFHFESTHLSKSALYAGTCYKKCLELK